VHLSISIQSLNFKSTLIGMNEFCTTKERQWRYKFPFRSKPPLTDSKPDREGGGVKINGNPYLYTRYTISVRGTYFDFRLPPRCWWDLRSSGILCVVVRQLFTDVSGQRIGPIFKGQESENGTEMYPETSVNNYHTTPRNIPEQCRSGHTLSSSQ
jgi:hypothetical protein